METIAGARESPANGGSLADAQLGSQREMHVRGVVSTGILEIVGTVIGPAALVTGLLYYFGWVRTHAIFSYFGVDNRLIEYSPSDYVLRSSAITFDAVIRVAFIALILVGFHRFMVAWIFDLSDKSRVQWRTIQSFAAVAQVIGVVLAGIVILAVLSPDEVGRPLGLIVPLLLIMSVALLGYVTHIRSVYLSALARTHRDAPAGGITNQEAERGEDKDIPAGSADQPYVETSVAQRRGEQLLGTFKRINGMWSSSQVAPYSRARALILLTLGLVGILWAVSLYAYQVGAETATRVAADLPNQSAIVLYSAERIAIDGPGVNVTEITQPGSKYHYQYSGLRWLTRSADTYLLLPRYWQRGRDQVFVIRDDGSIRIDVAAR